MSRLESGVMTSEIAKVIDEMPDGQNKHILKCLLCSVVAEKVNIDLLYERIKNINISVNITL